MGYSEYLYTHTKRVIALIGESNASIYKHKSEIIARNNNNRYALIAGGTGEETVEYPLYSPDGGKLAVSGNLGRMLVCDAKTGALLWDHILPVDVAAFISYDSPVFTSDGSAIWFPMAGKQGRVWLMAESATGKERLRVSLSDKTGKSVTLGTPQYLLNDTLILFRTMSWIDDKALCVLDTASGKVLWNAFFSSKPGSAETFIPAEMSAYEEGSAILASFRSTDTQTGNMLWNIERRDIQSGEPMGTYAYSLPGRTESASFSPDGHYWMTCIRNGENREARIYDMATGKLIAVRALSQWDGTPRWDKPGNGLLIEKYVPGSEYADAYVLWLTDGGEHILAAGSAQMREALANFIGRIGEYKRVTVLSDRFLTDIDSGETLLDAGKGFCLVVSPDGSSVFRYSQSLWAAQPRIIFWRPISEVIDSAKRIVAASKQ
jgi:WD40 repeat protein